jgi:hypothetical protein
LLFILVGGCSQKVQQENILAEFDGQVVRVDELEQEFSELSQWEQNKYKGQEGREEYLTLMAESRMLLRAAVEKGLDKDSEIVDQTREYRDQLMVKELVKREVDDKSTATAGELKSYYEEHKADYIEEEKVTIAEITVEDEEKAKEIVEKIEGGADFGELVKEMADKGESVGPGQRKGGEVTFGRKAYSSTPEFVNVAFDLEKGAISDIIVQPMASALLFSVDLKFQTDLDGGNLSEDLRQEFENNEITLSQDASISVGGRSGRWLIAPGLTGGRDDEGNNTWYIVEKDAREDSKLGIYSTRVYYMIIRAEDRIPSRQQELSEVESKIRRIVEKQKKKDRMDKWLGALKAEKKFQLYPERIPKVAEAEEEKAEETVEPGPSVSGDEQGTSGKAAEEKETDTEEVRSP